MVKSGAAEPGAGVLRQRIPEEIGRLDRGCAAEAAGRDILKPVVIKAIETTVAVIPNRAMSSFPACSGFCIACSVRYRFAGPYPLVASIIECKNWSNPVGSMEVSWFITKIRDRGLDFGVLVAANGVTGDARDKTAAHHVVSEPRPREEGRVPGVVKSWS